MKKFYANPCGVICRAIRSRCSVPSQCTKNHLIISLLRVMRCVLPLKSVPARSGGMGDFYENLQQRGGTDRRYAAGTAAQRRIPIRSGCGAAGKAGAVQSGRERKGSSGGADYPDGGAVRKIGFRRYHYRAYLRQHRHRSCRSGRGKGLSCDFDHAGDNERGTAGADPGLWRGDRLNSRRRRHVRSGEKSGGAAKNHAGQYFGRSVR
ncbi:hypothetical protein DSECCO2_290830 [anaerobic digester metagenome]